jgi:hypothetical protein
MFSANRPGSLGAFVESIESERELERANQSSEPTWRRQSAAAKDNAGRSAGRRRRRKPLKTKLNLFPIVSNVSSSMAPRLIS